MVCGRGSSEFVGDTLIETLPIGVSFFNFSILIVKKGVLFRYFLKSLRITSDNVVKLILL